MWLARECGRSCNHDIPIKIGDVISAETCKNYKKSEELMSFLKDKTYSLSEK
jgi:hypothetical protein